MASKRLASSSISEPSTPKSKKTKLTPGQQRLDNFFSPRSSKTRDQRPIQHLTAPFKSGNPQLTTNFAETDGNDLETMDQLEGSWRKERLQRRRSVTDATGIESGEFSVGPSTPFKPGSSGNPSKLARSIDMISSSATSPTYRELAVDPVLFEISGNPLWQPSTPAPYSFLVHALSTLSQTRSRIQIVNVLTNCLRAISLYHPRSLLPTLYLLSNALSPPYSLVELGLGPSVVSKALRQVSGLTSAALSKLYKTLGDPGDVAFAAKSSVRTLVPHPSLSIIGVYEALVKISRIQGQGASRQKQTIVETLLLSAKGEEVRYLVRTLFLNLRVGASQTTVLSALGRAMVLTPPVIVGNTELYASPELLRSLHEEEKMKNGPGPATQRLSQLFMDAEALVKHCFMQHPNLNDITTALLDVGLNDLSQHVPLTVGRSPLLSRIPLYPTLGSPMRSLDEIYERLQGYPFTAEFKYDGQRAQVHGLRNKTSDPHVKVFSRHLEDMTDKYPDVVALTRSLFASDSNMSSFILDAEIVAVERGTGVLKSFQDLAQRARKDVKIADIKISVCLFVFDLMYFNGQVLLGSPFRQRRQLLRSHFSPFASEEITMANLCHVESCESEDGRAAVEAFWKKAVDGPCEGLMVKLLDDVEATLPKSPSKIGKPRRKALPATYEPDKRTSAWLKLKKDYVTGLGDSLDLVPIGGWHGTGRKVKWWSPVLLAVRDSISGDFVAVSKCMTGFTDKFYTEMKERYPEDSETCSKIPRWNCRLGGFKPSVYFKPQEVWEIRGADITLSPVSVAAIDLVGERGLSLRFPRFIKVRDDKGLTQTSTPESLASIWRAQENRRKEKGGDQLLDAAEWESEFAVEEDEVF